MRHVYKPEIDISVSKLFGGGAVSSGSFDLMNSMTNDLKRPVDLRWLFDSLLHLSLFDVWWYCFDNKDDMAFEYLTKKTLCQIEWGYNENICRKSVLTTPLVLMDIDLTNTRPLRKGSLSQYNHSVIMFFSLKKAQYSFPVNILVHFSFNKKINTRFQ